MVGRIALPQKVLMAVNSGFPKQTAIYNTNTGPKLILWSGVIDASFEQ